MLQRTFYAWRTKCPAGMPVKYQHRCSSQFRPTWLKTAEAWSARGHRKVGSWCLDGHDVTESSVKRVMALRDLLLPLRYQA